MNLPLSLYRAEVGLAAAPPQAVAPVAWRSSRLSRRYRRKHAHRRRIFRWTDPLPACYYYLYERGLMRVWRRLVREFANPASLGNTRA